MLLSLESWGYFCPFCLPLGLWAPEQDEQAGEVWGQAWVWGVSLVSLIRSQDPFGVKEWVFPISKLQGSME